ncbi:MAG TPA: MnhB domain-containing protein [Egibacteraceae bacterium]|nr:MnhB domain-containing protein [Egibacteraceae bacterium]
MSARGFIGLAAVVLLGAWLVEGLLGLPGFGEDAPAYGLALADLALAERNATNAVSAVLFDLRALDTLGEALALFAGAAAVQTVLRELAGEEESEPPASTAVDRRPAPTGDAVRAVALWLVAPTVLYGAYIAARGHVSVGGGFQGGAIVAAAVALVFLAGRQATMHHLAPESALDITESIGAGGFLVVGLVALATGAGFLGNVLPLGEAGRLLSAGTIGVLSVLIGLEAASALATLIQKFVEQTVEIRQEEP